MPARYPLISGLFLASIAGYAQTGRIEGHLRAEPTDAQINRIRVDLLAADSDRVAKTDEQGRFCFRALPAGQYYLLLLYKRQRRLLGPFPLPADSTRVLSIPFPGPCPYDYASGPPRCPFNPADKLVPIVYGLPTPAAGTKAERGLLRLGGCLSSDCDPQYYCPTHKWEL